MFHHLIDTNRQEHPSWKQKHTDSGRRKHQQSAASEEQKRRVEEVPVLRHALTEALIADNRSQSLHGIELGRIVQTVFLDRCGVRRRMQRKPHEKRHQHWKEAGRRQPIEAARGLLPEKHEARQAEIHRHHHDRRNETVKPDPQEAGTDDQLPRPALPVVEYEAA